jgi:hypothetical protein
VELLLLLSLTLGEFVYVLGHLKVKLNSSEDLAYLMRVSFVFDQRQAVAVGREVKLLLDIVIIGHTDQQVALHVDVNVYFGVLLEGNFAADYNPLFCV